MKATLITYERLFPVAPYENIRMGIEMTVEEGECPDDVIKSAAATVQKWYAEMNNHDMRGTTERIIPQDQIPEIQVDKTEPSLVDAIRSCTVWEKEKGGLDSFTKLIKDNPEAQQPYNEMYEKLKNE